MKFSTRHTFGALLLVLFSTSVLPLEATYAQRPGEGNRSNSNFKGAGASPRVNSNVNLKNRGNINTGNVNRANVNTGNVNRANVNTGYINRGNVNTGYINRGNVNTGYINRGNINVGNTVWRGGGWYGGGYNTPPSWGLAAFAAVLAIGAIVNSPPPYYSPVVVGGNNYIYSEGVFLQPSGNSYVVIQPPIGAVVTSIPDGCTAANINGAASYNCSGVIYQPFYQGNSLAYQVISY